MVDHVADGKCVMGINYVGPVKAVVGKPAFNTKHDKIAVAQVRSQCSYIEARRGHAMPRFVHQSCVQR